MKQMHSDDAQVVAKARGGDQDAFRVLVERHSRSIYRLAYRMTGRPEDAEDVVQETLVRAYRQLGRFEARSNFATWLYRIGFNCAIDYMRARPQRESAETDEKLEQMAKASTGPSIDDLVFAGEIGERVQEALRRPEPAGTRGVFDAALPRLFDRGDLQHAGLEIERGQAFDFPRGKKMRSALRPLMEMKS